MRRGVRLRDDFAKEQNEQRHTAGSDSDSSRAERLGGRIGGDRSGPDVHDVVADQQSHEQPLGVGLQALQCLRAPHTLCCKGFRPRKRNRKQGDFRSGKHSGKEHEEAEQNWQELQEHPVQEEVLARV